MLAPRICGLPVSSSCLRARVSATFEFAVNQEIAFLKRIGRKEVELAEILYGERIDDNVALAALVAFHRVDGDVLQGRRLEARNLFSYHGNLVAVGHDDTYRPVRVETDSVRR